MFPKQQGRAKSPAGSLAAGECGAGSGRERPGQRCCSSSAAPGSRSRCQLLPAPASLRCSPGRALAASWLPAMRSFGMIRVRGAAFPWLLQAAGVNVLSWRMKSPGTGPFPSTEFHPQMHPLLNCQLLSCFPQARNIPTISTIYPWESLSSTQFELCLLK